MRGGGRIEPFPQVGVLEVLVAGAGPMAGLPAAEPAFGHGVDEVAGVGVEGDAAGGPEGLKGGDGGEEFHPVVGGAGESAGDFAGGSVAAEQDAEAPGAGIALGSSVGVDGDMFHGWRRGRATVHGGDDVLQSRMKRRLARMGNVCWPWGMWVWSKLSGVQWLDAWEERFYGNPNTVITHLKSGKSLRVEVYCESEAEAEEIRGEFGGSVRRMKKDGWMRQQVGRQEPLKIRNRLVITQDDRSATRRRLERQYPGRIVLSIPAEMAFGTGDHPTTATCLRYLTDEAKARQETAWSMLDMGCGSGVLALSARLLGAEGCEAMDYDPKAVEVAKCNLGRNGVSGVEISKGDVLTWRSRKKFEVVAANLFAGVLKEAFPRLAGALRQGGHLIISGILSDQWEPVREVADRCGTEVIEHKRRGKWVSALLCRKGEL